MGAHGYLQKSLGPFQLTGEAHPTLREVNGGRLCVNAFGKLPSGYDLEGNISLDECSEIAASQLAPLGFRWGRPGFDYQAYTRYAEKIPGRGEEVVDLAALFPGTGDFACTVYIGSDSLGQHYEFRKTNLSRRFAEKPPLQDGPAEAVCYQRWTMYEFFKPAVSELWFCYMPKAEVASCLKQRSEYYTQGKIFVITFLFFLAVLGWIMADLPEFEQPLVWVARFLINLELGLVSCGFLLERWHEGHSSVTFFLLAYVMDVVGVYAVMVPYWIMEWRSQDSAFNTAYLLLCAFSPCFLMEFMSYWSHFVLLVRHYPLLIGIVGFTTTALAVRFYDQVTDTVEEDVEGIARIASMKSMGKASYTSVPTDEPSECCNADQSFIACINRLPRMA